MSVGLSCIVCGQLRSSLSLTNQCPFCPLLYIYIYKQNVNISYVHKICKDINIGHGGRIDGAKASCTEGREFKSQQSQRDTCRYAFWRSALPGQDEDCLAQCLDTVTEWEMRQLCHSLVTQ